MLVAGVTMANRLHEIDLATRKDTTLPTLGYDEIRRPVELPDGRLLFASTRGFSMSDRDPGFFTMPRGGGAWARLGAFSGVESGTVLGCLIIGVLNNGLFLLDVSPFWQQVVKGVVISSP